MRVALVRVMVSTFWVATALYALLCAIPFASEQFIEPQLVPALTMFATWHAWISIAVLGVTAAGLWPWLRAGHFAVSALLGSWLVVGVLTFATDGLLVLEPSTFTLGLSLAALIPPVWLALVDLRSQGARAATRADETGVSADFVACAIAALVISGTHAVIALLGGAPPSTRWFAEWGSSALLHLVVFSAIFALISVIRGAARLVRQPQVEAWLGRAALAGMLGLFMYGVVLSALSMTGPTAVAVAASFGAALALVLGPRGTSAPDGIDAALSGCVPRWATGSTAMAGLWIALAMAAVAGAELALSGFDWNFTILKTIALASWLLALAAALRLVPTWLTRPVRSRAATAVAPFAACVLVLTIQQAGSTSLSAAAEEGSSEWISGDVSARLILDTLTPAAPAETGLFEYLQRHTNIPRSVHVDPVDVEFATLTTKSERRPHIFLFVIDSLRSDYLSPDNAAVDFTPSIARFAEESTVFERAFTRYGGTGLSIPSIWVGGLVLHKQYVTPFGPMNTLAKLLANEDYRLWLSKERIVDTILPANATVDPLDAGVPVKDHRFCRTLAEIRGRLDRMTESSQPVFTYTLPQDIHVATLARDGQGAIDADQYPGFDAAYASRVKRMDACFGEFVDDLKARGLYDESLIILTSDHGDSLGEQGRRGHAYTVFPEVIQVPLLIHLPSSLRAAFVARPADRAFTSDITPSIYTLLGHIPARPAEIFGHSLFSGVADPAPARPQVEVVASSYGSVYGALFDDARRLYIIDAVSLREFAYKLDGSAAGRAVPVREADREQGQRAIRATLEEISRFYGFRLETSR
jgi:hypothetical protein